MYVVWHTWLGYFGLVAGLIASRFLRTSLVRSAAIGLAAGITAVILLNFTSPFRVPCLQHAKGWEILIAFQICGEFGTAREAKGMLERAVAELRIDEARAVAKFNSGSDGFKDRDLYVFCFDETTGKFTADPALIGQDMRTLKDKNGKPFGEQLFDAAKEGEINTVDYMFPRPNTTEPLPKRSFVTRIGNQGCGVGYYRA